MADAIANRHRLTSAAIDLMLSAIREAATTRQLGVSVAVVDESATLRAFHRMDEASLISTELALNKARTAARTGRATHEWAALLEGNETLRTAATTSISDLVLFAGGLVVRSETGEILGGVGVSGAAQEDDLTLARAGLASLSWSQPPGSTDADPATNRDEESGAR